MISLDTEDTGLDCYHGTKPFFVTVCDQDGKQTYWEWDVDPVTREPIIPESDLGAIRQVIRGADRLVLQNGKFDYTALKTVIPDLDAYWDWGKVEDTLIAGHLLASNQPHDLTSMAIQYLGVDILPLEKALENATKSCRRLVKKWHPDWRRAEKGLPEMPSARKTIWKADTWLLRAFAHAHPPITESQPFTQQTHVISPPPHNGGLGGSDGFCKKERRRRTRKPKKQPEPPTYPDDHPWWTTLSAYGNADSAVTIAIWRVQEKEIKRRGLWNLYRERMKLPPLAQSMEAKGITLSSLRLNELIARYRQESEESGSLCVNLASSMGHDLILPRAGNNQSLLDLAESPTGLNLRAIVAPPASPGVVKSRRKNVHITDTGRVSLSRPTLEFCRLALANDEPRGKRLAFLKALLGKRRRDTAVQYLEGYRRFWLPLDSDGMGRGVPGWFLLHPSLNPTGTDTLRWSSSNPNESNISAQYNFNLRYCFGPAPGREWWNLDAKNLELRIPAYVAGEKEMIDIFERPNDPPYYGGNHLLNFHTVYPDIWEKELQEVGFDKVGPHIKAKYDKTWYRRCKNGSFGVQYGAIDREDGNGTADRAYGRPGCHAKLKARFAKVLGPGGLNDQCIRHAEKYGYVETLPDKAVDPKHGYPLMCTRTEYGKVLPTVPLSYFVQGSACWWMQSCMLTVATYLEQLNSEKGSKGYYMVLQVHDEIGLDFPFVPDHGNLPKIRHIQKLMEACGDRIGVPTPVGCEYHPETWSEGETL